MQVRGDKLYLARPQGLEKGSGAQVRCPPGCFVVLCASGHATLLPAGTKRKSVAYGASWWDPTCYYGEHKVSGAWFAPQETVVSRRILENYAEIAAGLHISAIKRPLDGSYEDAGVSEQGAGKNMHLGTQMQFRPCYSDCAWLQHAMLGTYF
jgi:hypothetical protein